ncbi:phage holin family protein [Enterobacter asburiae]|uniref:phage holin family protein n=1 Tax=Enterobacter asburiae TaxID=61645 RepID=UPI0021C5FBB6|nr:phage holin family protein [Enterobacter asburiae]MCU3444303.1 phage holin family protein [Enterobacter asburiae]
MEFLAYGLILAPAYTAFRIWHGDYVQVDYGEILINVVVCVAVWRAGGNIARIGASRVLLLGYDCSIRNGTHWHGNHAQLSNPDKFSVARWQDEFSRLRTVAGGVEIINCSRFTRLTCFPRQSLETALSL